MSIALRLQRIWKELPEHVRLVAVSKFHPAEMILEAYHAGQRIFGESKVQELTTKYEALPKDIEWHFIGHLQTNKVKYIAPFVNVIHSIDSIRLLEEVNYRALGCNRKIKVLLQLHIAQEATKFGFSYEECDEILQSGIIDRYNNISICGLMGMATFTGDLEQVHEEYAGLASYFKEVKFRYFSDREEFRELSMGMSDDYLAAIEEGSTLVRIGSKIFGERY